MAANVSPSVNFADGFSAEDLAEKIYELPGKQAHQEDIRDENENV